MRRIYEPKARDLIDLMQHSSDAWKIYYDHLCNYTGCILKKLNKSKIALRPRKAPQCTKFFIEIGCLATYNVE